MAIVIKKKVKASPPASVELSDAEHDARFRARVKAEAMGTKFVVEGKVRNWDGPCRVVLEEAPNAHVSYYLMTSWLYYRHDISIISDGLYDDICMYLKKNIGSLEHMHKHLIDDDALAAGTGFAIDFDNLPNMVIGGATHLAKACGYTPVRKR